MPNEPANTYRFDVTVDGAELGSFTAVDGLSAEYEVQTYEEGGQNGYVHKLPGRLKYQNIKVSRPVDGQSRVWPRGSARCAAARAPAPDGGGRRLQRQPGGRRPVEPRRRVPGEVHRPVASRPTAPRSPSSRSNSPTTASPSRRVIVELAKAYICEHGQRVQAGRLPLQPDHDQVREDGRVPAQARPRRPTKAPPVQFSGTGPPS